MSPRRAALYFLMICFASLGAGCSTFKYTPQHSHTYPATANSPGVAIRTGIDARAPEDKQPSWAKNAESIVAHALADEVKYAKFFGRVKIHADSANPKKYPTSIQFRVVKFQCAQQYAMLEHLGRELLAYQGIRGLLISDSIPSKYLSEVEIEFTVLNVSTGQTLFTKNYSATRNFVLNGYQSSAPKVENTSAALESVITQFVADLAKLPLSQQPL